MATTNKPEALAELRNKHVPKAPFNVTTAFIREARGAVMIDVDGRELIDFAGGIGVNNVGHCHPKVVAAIKDQADKYIHTCFHVAMYDTYVELAEKLRDELEKTPGVQVYAPPRGESWSGILAFTVEDVRPQAVEAALGAKGIAVRAGLHCAPWVHRWLGTLDNGGTVRVSPAYENQTTDIETLSVMIRQIVKFAV